MPLDHVAGSQISYVHTGGIAMIRDSPSQEPASQNAA